MRTIQRQLNVNISLSEFLSEYFYRVLEHYLNSFHNRKLGWKKVVLFSEAVDNFIEWCESSNFESEQGEVLFTQSEKILETLEQIRRKKAKITTFNTYHGVPIQYKATIIHTTQESVYIKAHPIQTAAAISQKDIYILGYSPLEYDIHAHVRPVKYKGHLLLELSSLNILKETLYQRQNVRVEPAEPVSISITTATQTYKVRLFDISLGGLAVVTDKRLQIEKYNSVKLKIGKNLLDKEIEIKAVLVHISLFETSQKYHFQLNLTSSQELLLNRYIAKREAQIIQRLKKWV